MTTIKNSDKIILCYQLNKYMENALKVLEDEIGNFDHLYQEGTIFTKADLKKLKALTNTLSGIVDDLENNDFGQLK